MTKDLKKKAEDLGLQLIECMPWHWHSNSVSDAIAYNHGLVFRTKKQAREFQKAYRELVDKHHSINNHNG